MSKSYGSAEKLARIPGALLSLMGTVSCAESRNVYTPNDFCDHQAACNDSSIRYKLRKISWCSGAGVLTATLAQP